MLKEQGITKGERKFSISSLSGETLLHTIESFIKGEPPLNPEAKFATEAFKKSWETRASLENKKSPLSTRIVLGPQVTIESLARKDFKELHAKAESLVKNSNESGEAKNKEKALIEAVEEFRPKDPQLIRDEYALAPTEVKIIEAFKKRSWEQAANYLSVVDEKLKISPAFSSLKERVSIVAQENLQFIAENFAAKLQSGFKTDNLTYLSKYLDLGISRQDLFEKSGALVIVSGKISDVLKDGPIKDQYTGISEYTKMGFSREQLLLESGALKIAATKIADEFRTGYKNEIGENLSEYESIGLNRKQLLVVSDAFNTAVNYLKEALKTYIKDEYTNLGDYVGLGLDRKALLQASGAVDIAAAKIADSLKIGRIEEVLDYIEQYHVIGLAKKDLVAAVKKIDPNLTIPKKKV